MHSLKSLKVKDLSVLYKSGKETFEAVKKVSFELSSGACLAIVGESGSGKSTIASSILGILDRSKAEIQGEILWGGEDLLMMGQDKLNLIRGSEISMIFQNPSQALHPMYTVEFQIEKVLDRVSKSKSARDSLSIAEAMSMARLRNVKEILAKYPHELSGGMKQRVMLAMALIGKPQLIVADEPTSALDVTVQLEVVELLRSIVSDTNISLLLISHHLGVVAGLADEVLVLKNGVNVESGVASQVLVNPKHSYTRDLIGIHV